MESINVLNQMAKYDFNSPIDVTMIFEDSDDDTTYKNVLREQCENIHDYKNKDGSHVEKCISEIKVNKNNENLNKKEDLNKSQHSKIPKTNPQVKTFCKTSEEIIILDIDENVCNNGKTVKPNKNTDKAERLNYQIDTSNQRSLIVRDGETQKEREIILESAPVNINHLIIDQEPVTTFIEDMLNKLSENLIVIMQTFYHYGIKRNVCDDTVSQELRKREHIFNVLKFHFFELSYTTIESIILPQEQDVNFIKTFLDNTVLKANKSLKFKYHRQHVEPFFNEILIWAKQKRAGIEAFKLKSSSSENFFLRRHLLKPSQPLNLQHSKSVPSSDKVQTSTTQNNLCIFSSGAPGSEISINITPDTLRNCTQRQYNNTVECRNQNNYPSSGQSASRITPPPPYEKHRNNYYQMNYTNYIRHRQPVAGVCRLKTKNKTNSPMIQNIIHPTQNNQNFGQPIQNYPSQAQYVNTTETSPCGSSFLQSYPNRNNNQMKPYTTVRSRCIMCGKYTETKCSKCNYPSYCSYLCQDLDNQFRKSMGGTT